MLPLDRQYSGHSITFSSPAIMIWHLCSWWQIRYCVKKSVFNGVRWCTTWPSPLNILENVKWYDSISIGNNWFTPTLRLSHITAANLILDLHNYIGQLEVIFCIFMIVIMVMCSNVLKFLKKYEYYGVSGSLFVNPIIYEVQLVYSYFLHNFTFHW